MSTDFKFKPIGEIPRDLWTSLWGGLDGNELEICFWEGDDEAGLHLSLLQNEIRQIEEYGVTDELIEWMRDNDMFTVNWTVDGNGDVSNYESFIITDQVVARFYAT